MMASGIVRFGLKVIKFCGLFYVARYVTRDGLRIICYHGFALADEHEYRGKLFIRGEFFRRRIQYLQRTGYTILRLDKALEALWTDALPPCAIVITMDDGWRGVYTVGLPIIKELYIPATVYVTTYYVQNPMPVFTVTLSYLFWRSTARTVDLPRELGRFDLDEQAAAAEKSAQEFGALLPSAERLEFLKEIADALDVSFAEIERQQLFRVMDEQQLRCLDEAGVDIQLHSHSHEWPLYDRTMVETEIAENRGFLQGIVSHSLEHFCYPSGVYGLHQGEWLAALGVKSATTIDPGLNFAETSPFALRRLLDGHPVSDIEFEAEVTGFMELIRALRERRLFLMMRRRFRPHRHPIRTTSV
jgi:peptidoglycan/xylan/chitin deacetylase (PgdA/CDA1 family)